MKLKTKLFFFTISVIIFNGCVAKKNTIKKIEEVKQDSTFIKVEKEIIKSVKDTIFIDSPCDSLGVLKPFNYSLIVPQGKINLNGLNNNITGEVDLKGYEKTIETKYKLMYEKKISEIKEAKVILKTPLWMWLTIIFETIIIVLLIKLKWF